MKLTTLFLTGLAGLALVNPGSASMAPQPIQMVTKTEDGCNLDWYGLNSRTYFVQYSLDLQTWSYFPVIESGAGADLGYGFVCDTDMMFVRLVYTDTVTSEPYGDDFDGDGISNWNEIREGGTGTDPFLQDTDGDGILDNGLVLAAQNDPDGAGLSPGVQNGLIGRWDFEALQGPLPLSFEDKTGNGHHAITVGASIDSSDGIISKSCNIPDQGYLSVPPTIMGNVKAFNLSMWVKPTVDSLSGANSSRPRVLWSHGYSQSSLPLLYLYLQNEKDVILQRYNNGVIENVASWTAPEKLDDGNWRHLCLSRADGGVTGTRYRLYINGEQVGADWGGGNNSFTGNATGYFYIGRLLPTNNLAQYDGLMDRVLLHNRGLSQTEAQELYRYDADGDQLWDITEYKSRLWRDTNGDRIPGTNEYSYFISPYHFDPTTADHDDDGRTSVEEQNDAVHPTNLFLVDSDGDLIPDGWEVENGLDPNDPNDATIDSDGDGADNRTEYAYTSNPHNPDTDGDGILDGIEINGPDGNPDTVGGSNPADASDNGQPLPSEEKLVIVLGVGDQSTSHSEDYVMNVFRVDPVTGEEKRFYTLRSGGHGQYKEIPVDIFRKDDTYTFQIDWQSTNNGVSVPTAIPDGPDFDYTFKVEPQNDTDGILTDAYDVELRKETPSITGTHDNVQQFVEKREKPKRVKRSHIRFDLWVDSDMDGERESNVDGDKLPEGFFGKGSDDENKEDLEQSVIIDINNDNTDSGVAGSPTSGQVDNANNTLDTEADRQDLTSLTRPGHNYGTMKLVTGFNEKFLQPGKWELKISFEPVQGQTPAPEQVVRVFRWESYSKDKSEPKELIGPGKTEATIPLDKYFGNSVRNGSAAFQSRDLFVEGLAGGYAIIKVTMKEVVGQGQAAPREFTDKVRITCNVDRVAQAPGDVATKKDSRALRGQFPHYMGARLPNVGGLDTEGNAPAVRAIRGRIIARPASYTAGSGSSYPTTSVTWMRDRKLRQFYAEPKKNSGSSFWIGLKETDANGKLVWTQCGLRWLQDEEEKKGSEPFAYLETGAFLPNSGHSKIVFNRQNAAPREGDQNDGPVVKNQLPLRDWDSAPLILDFVMYKLPGAQDANGADVSIWPWEVIFKDSRTGKDATVQSNYISLSTSWPTPTSTVGDPIRDAFLAAYKGEKLTDLDVIFETNQTISFIPGTSQAPAEMKNLHYALGLNGGVTIDSRPNDPTDKVAFYNWAINSFQWHNVVISVANSNIEVRTGKSLANGEAEKTIQQPYWWGSSIQNNGLKLWDTRDWGFGATE